MTIRELLQALSNFDEQAEVRVDPSALLEPSLSGLAQITGDDNIVYIVTVSE